MDRGITALPEGVQYLVWKSFNSSFVLKELLSTHSFLWEIPSELLINLCNDNGTIQQGHHDLEDMIEDHDMWAFKNCIESKCLNCQMFGFPCGNLAIHGFKNHHISELWNPNFF
jgi:hypothetical protein